ncbi:MAG: hypothetical protein KC505_09990, partial [Myxococcales bacterium]|nr:hypothetical protein [Myxococcales bacterium]
MKKIIIAVSCYFYLALACFTNPITPPNNGTYINNFLLVDQKLNVYSNYPLEQNNPSITSIILAIAGHEHAPEKLLHTMNETLKFNDSFQNTLLIVPFFKTINDNIEPKE